MTLAQPATGPGLPPLSSNGVLALSSSAVIQAPPDKVWEILMDFSSYREWNPFVRSISVVDASKKPTAEQSLSMDKFLSLKVNIPPSLEDTRTPQTTLCTVFAIDAENRRVSWGSQNLPRWILRSERWQSVSAADAEGTTSKYESIEVFQGLAAYIIKFFLRKGLQQGFDGMASGLKSRAEQH